MSDPVGAVSGTNAAQYAMAVVRKEHSQQDVEGQEAVQLIQSTAAPQLETSGSIGTKLNFVA